MKKNKLTISTTKNNIYLKSFFDKDYRSFSVYNNVRMIGSYIDGQKNASRKIVYTLIDKCIKKLTKVSVLGPQVQSHSNYLHGSLEATIVKMTADYIGSGNNIPLLDGDGNFGSAFIPRASATRYIFAKGSTKNLLSLFVSDDTDILSHQTFEGDKIEPKFYVPILPLIAINGSDGVGIGFAQKILPRNENDVIKWIRWRLRQEHNNKTKNNNTTMPPYWNGMQCIVVPHTDGRSASSSSSWEVHGHCTRKTPTSTILEIDCIPIGYDLSSYTKVLVNAVDTGVINKFDDLSDNDIFKFRVSLNREDAKKHTGTEYWVKKLKLIQRVTENYTCIDENNKIREFDSIYDIMDAWYTKRMEYNKLRKENKIMKLSNVCDTLFYRLSFIRGVIAGKIILKNNDEKTIIDMANNWLAAEYQTSGKSFFPDGIISKNLMSLPLRSLTICEVDRLENEIEKINKEMAEYSKLSLVDMLSCDIKRYVYQAQKHLNRK